MEGASPRPEKRADIAKKERVKQLGVHSYPFPLWRNAAVLLLHPPLEGEGRPLERSESGRGGVNVRKERSPHPARHSASKTRVNALMARDPPPPGEGKDSGRTEPPVFFAAPGRPSSGSSPLAKPRGWRAKRRVLSRSHVPFPARGASRRAIAAFSPRRRAALSAQLLACLSALRCRHPPRVKRRTYSAGRADHRQRAPRRGP